MNSTPRSAIITMNDSHLRGLIISYFRTPEETPNMEFGKQFATPHHRIKMIELRVAFQMMRQSWKEYAEVQELIIDNLPPEALLSIIQDLWCI
mgnify:CR=1 FL=1|tara:strand:+ start:66 stop:344 length:279 start_codon:yes stop_codon:yes gene_type:complete